MVYTFCKSVKEVSTLFISKVAERLSKDLKTYINDGDIRFYENEGIFNFKRTDNNYRDITEKDMVTMRKAFMLLELGTDIETVVEVIANKNKRITEELREELKVKQNYPILEML